MRAASFVGLRDLIGLVAEHPEGLRAHEIETAVKQRQLFLTRRGRVPSRTTIYHYRNILLHLGVLVRQDRLYRVDRDHSIVRRLMPILSPGLPGLSDGERLLFAELVVNNADCRRLFFDLFLPGEHAYGLDDLLASTWHVAWSAESEAEFRRIRLRTLEDACTEQWLSTEDQVQAILYGVRYWARDELLLLDELFLEDLGGVMYAIRARMPVPDPEVVRAFLATIDTTDAWTTLAVRDAIYDWGPFCHAPISRIHETLRAIHRIYPEYLVFIPTSEAFATITAASWAAEEYQLRGYLKDEQGRYISHLRVHRKLKEAFEWATLLGT